MNYILEASRPSWQRLEELEFKKRVVVYMNEVRKRNGLRKAESMKIFDWNPSQYKRVVNYALRENYNVVYFNPRLRKVLPVTDEMQTKL